MSIPLRFLRHSACQRAALFCAVALLAGCADDTTSPLAPRLQASAERKATPNEASLVIGWDDVLMEAIRQAKPAPTVVARSLAVLHTAMYDAWAAYDDKAVGTRLGGSLRRPPAERTESNKRNAVSFAAYRVLIDLFPSYQSAFNARMSLLGYDAANISTEITTAAGVGNVAAAAVLGARHRDGSNQLGDLHTGAYSDYTLYAPVNSPEQINDPLRWQPLAIGTGSDRIVQKFATPQWGLVTPFALKSGSQFRPAKVKYQESPRAMQREIDDALEYSRNLDDRTKVIAEYWADGPSSELPPGHWCLFAAWVSRRDHNTLDQDVKLFFVVANAVLDAGIAAWDAKRHFDSARPISAIHYFMAGKRVLAWGGPYQGTREIRGEKWQPYQPASVVTPPFSEFVSGHSTYSAAAAEVIKRFTGSDAFGASVEILAGSSKVEPGAVPSRNITLAWKTFSDAADEAGLSRRYGGIHFAEGDLEGRRMGRKIGALVWEKAKRYFEGKA